jgi:hypothetical protein
VRLHHRTNGVGIGAVADLTERLGGTALQHRL